MKRKLFGLLLAISLVISQSYSVNAAVIPTSYNWRQFNYQNQSSFTRNPTMAIQLMLLSYNSDIQNYVITNGGIDGSFGSGTANAVAKFQRARGLNADGSVGPDTWAMFYNCLSVSSNSGDDIFYKEILHITVEQILFLLIFIRQITIIHGDLIVVGVLLGLAQHICNLIITYTLYTVGGR